ncbi:MAG: hypothetical protein GQ526_00680 [Ardenticatenales bacterium]|jgi:gas vesicle protein|nr:hypothetical protein [Ardenticatenales bacterium]
MNQNGNWRVRTVLIGGTIGALLGIAAGLLLVRVTEESGGPNKLSTGQAIKLAVAALGVVRQASQLGS